MTDNDIIAKLQKTHPNVHIAYGGDGTLVQNWSIAKEIKRKPIFPIRNYGRCMQHEKMVDALLNGDTIKDLNLKMSVHPILECSWMNDQQEATTKSTALGLAEIQLKNKDITSALRFNVYVNSKKYYDNVIADAILASTSLGATGYWKSITRTIFREGFGATFIAPTVGISSVVLKSTDNIQIEFVRDAELVIANDKNLTDKIVKCGDMFDIRLHDDNMSIIGYDHFMCYECRKNRNSTILQDQYII